METPDSQENSARSVESKGHPFLIPLGILRLVIGIICSLPFILFLQVLLNIEQVNGVGMPFLVLGLIIAVCIGLPSLVTSYGLCRSSKWAIWAAVVHDGSLVSCFFGYALAEICLYNYWPGNLSGAIPSVLLSIMFWLVPIMEGLYLLSIVTNRRYSRIAFVTLAFSVLLTTFLIPVSAEYRKVSNVKPLIAYVRAHWVHLPKTIGIEDVSSESFFQIIISTANARWQIRPTKVGSGQWFFKGGNELIEEYMAMSGGLIGNKNSITSSADARKALKEVGVSDKNLRAAGMMSRFNLQGYCFQSPKAGGTFVVFRTGGVYLYLQRNTKVP